MTLPTDEQLKDAYEVGLLLKVMEVYFGKAGVLRGLGYNYERNEISIFLKPPFGDLKETIAILDRLNAKNLELKEKLEAFRINFDKMSKQLNAQYLDQQKRMDIDVEGVIGADIKIKLQEIDAHAQNINKELNAKLTTKLADVDAKIKTAVNGWFKRIQISFESEIQEKVDSLLADFEARIKEQTEKVTPQNSNQKTPENEQEEEEEL